jgi:hypothetical protein
MNAKNFLRLGVPPGEATRRATDFVAKFRPTEAANLALQLRALFGINICCEIVLYLDSRRRKRAVI